MTYKLNSKQQLIAEQKDANQRYDYCVNKVCQFEEIWSLCDEQGWVELSDSDGEICLPVWPHPNFAKAWVSGEWANCQPKMVRLQVWLNRWTAGLQSDDTLLVVFPLDDDEGVIQTPQAFHDDLLSALN